MFSVICMDVFIYALMDPETNAVRYIGKTLTPKIRFSMHMCEKRGTHKNNWLHQLRARGLRPVMVVIETIHDSDDNDWQARERYWIEHYRSAGEPITNLDSGGNGGKLQSEETKDKIRKANMGRKRSEETRLKISLAKSNPSDETREKLRQAKLGKKQSEETKRKRAESRMGHRHSPETIKKLKAARRAWAALRPKAPPRVRPKVERKPISEETRERLRLSHMGKTQSEETKRKRATAMMGHEVTAVTREKLRLAHLGKPKPRKALIPAPEAPSLAV